MPFPVVDAFLLTPEEGKTGKIAICTNTMAPSMVINEIPLELRDDVSVMGSLVVSRDGAERMIVNALSHPNLEYIILFGEETLSFRPSTNLLLALMHGYDPEKKGNMIVNGKGISHQYPSIPAHLLDLFKKKVKLIPLYKHTGCDEIIKDYVEWLRPQVPSIVYETITEILAQKKIYYNSLTKMVEVLKTVPKSNAEAIELDPQDFQHLQPPIVEIEEEGKKEDVPFTVVRDGMNIRVYFKDETISGNDSFLIAYSIMKHGVQLTTKQALLLGAELSRVEIEIRNDIPHEPFVESTVGESVTEIPLANRTILKADTKYYYKIGVKEGKISVQSLAHDTCESVFELRSTTLLPLLDRIASEDRFEQYEQTLLHQMDIGIETARAALAVESDNSYFQDFRNLFSINEKVFPLFIVEADSFLANHQKMITKLYTNGLTTQHPDSHKGTMRSATVLAVYRRSGESLTHFPAIYKSGDLSTTAMREAYKEQLLSAENSGTYTYGNRTRAHFGTDQLQDVVKQLRNGKNVAVIQRFDFTQDMTLTETEVHSGTVVRTRLEATHDPCLTHDIYFVLDRKLHSFHIARAHNIVNAYPENVFGLHDAYDSFVAGELGLELGDMFVLSNRGNVLLLTEEQKAKQLIAEPAKPMEDVDTSMGPAAIGNEFPTQGIAYTNVPILIDHERPDHPDLEWIENYNGTNLIEKVTQYLRKRGDKHNNPILGTHPYGRLVFFQCNQRGGKLQATAVFLEGSSNTFWQDMQLCNYLATQYHTTLEVPVGNLFFFYVPIQ